MLFSVPVSYWELQSPPLLIDGGYNKKQMHTEHLLRHSLVTNNEDPCSVSSILQVAGPVILPRSPY